MAVTGATHSRRRLALPDRALSEHAAAAEKAAGQWAPRAG